MSTVAQTNTKVHEEDVELVQRLAKLQEMHQQIAELRNLLPTKLLAPTRDALDKKITPTDLAKAVSTAVQTGRRDIKSFRENWHDEKTRDIFQKVSMSGVPQGVDAWNVDYIQLADSSTLPGLPSNSAPSGESQISADFLAYYQGSREHITITFPKEVNKLPIHVTVGGMQFSVADQSGSLLIDVLDESPNKKLARQIADQIQKTENVHRLETLLDILEAYHDIKTQACNRCNQIYDEDVELPVLRRVARVSGSTDQKSVWRSFHVNCV